MSQMSQMSQFKKETTYLDCSKVTKSDEDGLETDEECVSWTWDDLKEAQKVDKKIGCIIKLMKDSSEEPDCKKVTLKSSGVKTLWSLWTRLQIRDGILKRKFEDVDRRLESWQVVLPHIYRGEFMRMAHGGMTGEHLGYRKILAAIQARGY